MCGLIGCTGCARAYATVTDGLSRLEYRGYDSAGIAVADAGEIRVKKGVGKVNAVLAPFNGVAMPGAAAIGHVRWANHGAVSTANAHPFLSCDSRIAVVHNGLVTNHEELRKALEAAGHVFSSETDSEVIVHLIEAAYAGTMDPLYATRAAFMQVAGDNAFVALFSVAGVMTGARRGLPLVIGVGSDRTFVSSDVVGFLKWTDRAIFVGDGCSFMATKYNVNMVDAKGDPVAKDAVQVPWEFAETELRGYKHYTLKEIEEQPAVLARIASMPRSAFTDAAQLIDDAMNVVLVGAGSSYNAAAFFRALLNQKYSAKFYALSSEEFKHASTRLGPRDVIVAFSQSGETADTLDAVRAAKRGGARALSFVNTPGSSLVRESDVAVSMGCGPEMGVAATKSFTASLYSSVRVLEAITGARMAGKIENDVNTLLQTSVSCAVDAMAGHNDVYMIGSGLGHPLALEGALKTKELALVHAEGLASSEFKHGPLALRNGTPVLCVDVGGESHYDVVTSAEALKVRGAVLIGITSIPDQVYDSVVHIPSQDDICGAIEAAIPLQRIAYELALRSNIDPDHPRNLATSVTVR
ncbi:MAG: glutamine--fructose-6-phosphate transaminase (isomerizing) [Nitrososphaerota archaeon]|jgi:glucosamine--fructose-6-phosphate aminotransferase (isomerizing)|nr:glutamine--fructose-6-phosphate transaminase (isomerizing) [Nitrososphaerota archaeon]MDG6948749.1 glutamine--fructose-6-phosphate transaminase (isomerizing) [Nitrososphaerota archaeon]